MQVRHHSLYGKAYSSSVQRSKSSLLPDQALAFLHGRGVRWAQHASLDGSGTAGSWRVQDADSLVEGPRTLLRSVSSFVPEQVPRAAVSCAAVSDHDVVTHVLATCLLCESHT